MNNLIKTLDSLEKSATEDSFAGNFKHTEPALHIGTSSTTTLTIAALIYTLIAHFYPKLVSEDMMNLIVLGVALFGPMVTSWLIRSKVYSPKTVKSIVDVLSGLEVKPKN